jgi:dihydroorotase-like cyclic amidohydrolase
LLNTRAPLAPRSAAPALPMLIVGGRVLDPASGLDQVADVRLRDGRIVAIAPELAPDDGETVLDAGGRLVLPGFVDLHSHLGEPGHEERETLATGTRAAAAGGYTTVCCLGDTSPRLDTGAELAALQARAEGLAVTAEVSPLHLLLDEDAVLTGPHGRPFDSSTRLDPPLRSAADAAALRAGVTDGTIVAIATDHRPQRGVDKDCEYAYAAAGASVLETAFGALMELVASERLSLQVVVRALTSGPAQVFGLEAGRLAVDGPADLVVADPETAWTVDPARFHSRGKSTPLAGRTLRGRVLATLVGGAIVHREGI